MAKKVFSTEKVKKITGAVGGKPVGIPFYYTPPFLDFLREQIKKSLSSSGGRPTIQGADIVRKIRFSEENWKTLNSFSINLKCGDMSISPAQIAGFLLDVAISEIGERIEQMGDSSKTTVKALPSYFSEACPCFGEDPNDECPQKKRISNSQSCDLGLFEFTKALDSEEK